MATTYNFFIEKNNYESNELMINLDYPIECMEKERLVLKLVDFKYLNSAYNISEALDNNKFNITSFIAAYNEYLFNNVGTNYNLIAHDIGQTLTDGFVKHHHLETLEEVFIGHNYSLYYGMPINQPPMLQGYTPQGQPIYYSYLVANMFQNVTSFNILYFDLPHQNYIKLFKKHTTTWDDKLVLQKIYIHMMFSNEGNVNQYGATISITFKVEVSNDNVTYATLSGITDNTISFAPYAPTASTYINLNNTTDYNYYKISILSRNFEYANKLIVVDKMLFYKRENYIVNTPEINTSTLITIPDGFYNVDNLISTINTASSQITMTKQQYTNKITITNETPITVINIANPPQVIPELRQLKFINKTTANMYGFNDVNIILNNAPITSNKYINIMNFSKIIISTDLTFPENTTNDISNDKSVYTKGIGNIISWHDADEPPFTCIKYKNIENITNKINERHLQSFKIMFCNEKSMPLVLDNFMLHLQIIKYKK
jgi:hypothetical protein